MDISDLDRCGGDVDCLLHRLLVVLEKATGMSGQLYPGFEASGKTFTAGAAVRFPQGRVIAVERVAMWVDGEHVHLAMWPCELLPQYKYVYSEPRRVEALIALTNHAGWELNSNFHLAYRFARPQQRWYPPRHLPGPAYLRQWIDDFRTGRAGARTRSELMDPSFGQWLVQRSYAKDDDLASLNVWINEQSPKRQFHVRPSAQVQRTWQLKDAVALDRTGEYIAEVRATINRIFRALGEARLSTDQAGSDTN